MCVIGSFKPSKTKSNKLFVYPLTKLLKIQWMNQHSSFSSCCHVGVYIIIEEVVQVSNRFLHALEGLWYAINLLFKSLQEESSCVSHAPHSHHSLDDFLTIHLC